MKIKRGRIYNYRAKKDTVLEGKNDTYYFEEGKLYSARVLLLNISQIGVNSTRVTVNTDWLLRNFTFTGELWKDNKV
jgi:hypothetical protein